MGEDCRICGCAIDDLNRTKESGVCKNCIDSLKPRNRHERRRANKLGGIE